MYYRGRKRLLRLLDQSELRAPDCLVFSSMPEIGLSR